jgi:hypothetical protein
MPYRSSLPNTGTASSKPELRPFLHEICHYLVGGVKDFTR